MADKIPLEDIVSSNIVRAGFDPQKQILALQFTGGDIYHYAPFSLDQATAFYNAESKGRFYASQIKGKISGMKMTADCPKCGDRHGWIGETCAECGCAVYTAKARP